MKSADGQRRKPLFSIDDNRPDGTHQEPNSDTDSGHNRRHNQKKGNSPVNEPRTEKKRHKGTLIVLLLSVYAIFQRTSLFYYNTPTGNASPTFRKKHRIKPTLKADAKVITFKSIHKLLYKKISINKPFLTKITRNITYIHYFY